ncbi:hypothetical protein PENSOL_c043G00784 [Penicillium solitum]|uniref:Uncharacterized protein n=1 Tax=Penicillium solitum TaxID=60172 RepID=A0A1V6QSN7_9EURO|nr:uncharacterized protein PENSOL_c043G00784 [Penicillium solitum]OQD92240.1 hypothetical protein PENSOL_c043G00784 [Penicillium solitum]
MPLGSLPTYYCTCPRLYKYRDIHRQRRRYRYKNISLGVSEIITSAPTPYHKPPISSNVHRWYIHLRATPRLPGSSYGVASTDGAGGILLRDFERGRDLEVVGITQMDKQGTCNGRKRKERRKDGGDERGSRGSL